MNKYLKNVFCILLCLLLLAIAPVQSLAASKSTSSNSYTRTGWIYPDIIGLGAKDIIKFSVSSSGKIYDISVRQLGGNMLGVIHTTPKGYEIKASKNIIYTYWWLEVSAPVKIFNLSKALKEKVIKYTLHSDGTADMEIVSVKKIK